MLEVTRSLTTNVNRRSFMLTVCQGGELSICLETFRSFILRSLPPPPSPRRSSFTCRNPVALVELDFLIYRKKPRWRLLSLDRPLILWRRLPKSPNKRLMRTFQRRGTRRHCQPMFLRKMIIFQRPFGKAGFMKMIAMIYANGYGRQFYISRIFTGTVAFCFFLLFFSFSLSLAIRFKSHSYIFKHLTLSPRETWEAFKGWRANERRIFVRFNGPHCISIKPISASILRLLRWCVFLVGWSDVVLLNSILIY